MIAVDGAGRAWLATNGEGLCCIDGTSYRRFSVAEGLPHSVVYSVVTHTTARGDLQIWGSTVRGVFRLSGAPGDERVMCFDKSDGLGGDECNGRAVLKDRTQRLWFGNTGGASWISLLDAALDAPPASVFLTAFRVRALGGDLQHAGVSGAHSVSGYEFLFDYAAVENVSPFKLVFRFRLRGLEDDWVRTTTERCVRYTNLAPGKYSFEVSARNWTGQWSPPATLSFDVHAPA
jgi:hypothetical protein